MDIKGIEPFRWEHYEAMRGNIHEGNQREAWALFHMSAEEALKLSIEGSDKVWAGVVENRPIAIIGLVYPKTLLCDTGTPWLVCSDLIQTKAISFLRGFRKMMPYMFDRCGVLVNYVDARNTAVLRMVQWVGFEVEPPRQLGLDSLPFHRIEMKRGDCPCVRA